MGWSGVIKIITGCVHIKRISWRKEEVVLFRSFTEPTQGNYIFDAFALSVKRVFSNGQSVSGFSPAN